MSDTSQGPGWWMASDRKWYPPHLHPAYVAPPQPPGFDHNPRPAITAPMAASAPSAPQTPAPVQSTAPSRPQGHKTSPWILVALGVVVVVVIVAVFLPGTSPRARNATPTTTIPTMTTNVRTTTTNVAAAQAQQVVDWYTSNQGELRAISNDTAAIAADTSSGNTAKLEKDGTQLSTDAGNLQNDPAPPPITAGVKSGLQDYTAAGLALSLLSQSTNATGSINLASTQLKQGNAAFAQVTATIQELGKEIK